MATKREIEREAKREIKLGQARQKYMQQISDADNATLLDMVLDLARGDDYDGCFTSEGEWQYNRLIKELEARLEKCGFLPMIVENPK